MSWFIYGALQPVQAQGLKLQQIGGRVVLENQYVRAVVNPAQGARIESFIHKADKQELTQSLGETIPGGLLSDGVWQQNFWHGDWARANYTVTILEQSPAQIKVRFSSPEGAHWTGISFSKTLTLRPDSTALGCEYSIASSDNANVLARPDFHFHQGLTAGGKVFLPTESGVIARPLSGESESWVYDPSRGWLAYVNGDGTGLGFSFDFKRLLDFRTSQSANVTTLEWLFRKTDFKPGARETTSVQLAAFSGLDGVNAVGEKCAVEMSTSTPQNGVSQLKLKFAPFQSFSGKLSVYVRALGDGKSTPAFMREIKFEIDKPTTIDQAIKLSGEGNWVVSGVLHSDGMANLAFEQPVFVKGGKGVYAMLPKEQRTGEFPDSPTWSRYKPLNLNFNSTAIETPHRDWVKSWVGGRPKVLALMPKGREREAVEMAQRFDMDLTCAFLVNDVYYVLGDAVRSLRLPEVQRNMEKILDQKFDVIIASFNAWPLLTDAAKQKVLAQCKNGTGLVMPLRGAPPSEFKEEYPLDFLAYDGATGQYTLTGEGPPILNALPYEALPMHYYSNGSKPRLGADGKPIGHVLLKAVLKGADRGPLIAINEIGGARFVFAQTEGDLIPSYSKYRSYRDLTTPMPDFDYWEYDYAMMARLIYWAAHKESSVSLLNVEGSVGGVRISLESKTMGSAQVEVTTRDYFGVVIESTTQNVSLQNGTMNMSVPLTKTERGAFVVDVIVRNNQGVLAFGAGTFPVSPIQIADLALEKPVYQPSETATIIATLEGAVPRGSTLRVQLWDGANRHVTDTAVPAAATTKITLPLNRVIGARYRIHASLVVGDKVFDQAFVEGRIQVARDYQKYKAFFWGGVGGNAPENVIRATFDLYRRMGMNANWGNETENTHDARFLQLLDMPYTRTTQDMRTAEGVTKEQSLQALVENGNIISDPNSPQTFFNRGAKDGAEHRDEDLLQYSTADENRASSKDMDFSENGKKALRDWLQKYNYKTLADLNKSWGTEFASWDAVVAMSEAEARDQLKNKKTAAPWLDQRRYMVWGAAQLARKITDGVRSQDPTALVGESGTQEPGVYYSDRDWWQMSKSYNALAAYGGVQTMQQESYNPDLIRYTWTGYGKPSPLNRAGMLNALGNYDKGIAIFAAPSHIDPDFTLSEPGRSVRGVLVELKRGLGQMLVSAQPKRDPVYVLQSESSIFGAYMMGLEPLNKTSRYGMIQLLSDIGIGYKYISYEQLAAGEMMKNGGRVLVLPMTVALSPEEMAAIREWTKAGGTLIADMQIGMMDEHGKLYDKPQLDDVFGLNRTPSAVANAAKDASWVLNGTDGQPLLNFKTIEQPLAGAAKPKWQLSNGVAACYQNDFGKGHAYYFGADIMGVYSDVSGNVRDPNAPAQIQFIQNLFAGLIRSAAVKPSLTVRLKDENGVAGDRCPWVWTRAKESGKNRFFIIQRNYGAMDAPLPDVPVRVELEEPGVIYDVVAGKLLGRGDSVDLTMVNYTSRVLAVLPGEVTSIEVTPDASVTTRNKDVPIAIEVITADKNRDSRVVHVAVFRPDGTAHESYSTDLTLKNAKGVATIPFALNDPTGAWRVRVTDVSSGVTRDVKLMLL